MRYYVMLHDNILEYLNIKNCHRREGSEHYSKNDPNMKNDYFYKPIKINTSYSLRSNYFKIIY